MNISSKISYDTSYSTSSASERKIEQNIPEVSRNNNFKSQLDNIRKTEKRVEKKSVAINEENLEELEKIIDDSNKQIRTFGKRLDISIHEKTSEVMVKIVDTVTDEIIKEIPPEEVLDTLAHRREIIGLLMDLEI